MPRYSYPSHLLTFSDLARCASHGVALSIPRNEATFVRRLDSQQALKRGIYGGGFLLSDRQAGRMEEALREADRLKAEKAASVTWAISDREREIIAQLSAGQA